MPLSAKHFAAKLNECFDETGAPPQIRERAAILSKMLNIPKQTAWSLLEGQQLPNQELLDHLSKEFEVDPKWLTGNQ